MRAAFSNYSRNMNNKSNTHTTMLIDVHNRTKQLLREKGERKEGGLKEYITKWEKLDSYIY